MHSENRSHMNCIKELLKSQGRSQTWLSEKSGIRYTLITNYCNNKTKPDPSELKRIAKILGVHTAALLLSSQK
jgi:putative transcriptional regulator